MAQVQQSVDFEDSVPEESPDSSNVKVVIRVRPTNTLERGQKQEQALESLEDGRSVKVQLSFESS